MKKIKKKGIVFFILFVFNYAHALEVQFSTQADREELMQDESLSLIATIEVNENYTGQPQFSYDAPDFYQLSQSSNQFLQSFFNMINGKTESGVKTNFRINTVLRPKKSGKLKISNITAVVDGKKYAQSDIIVDVTPPGQGTPPPQGYRSGLGLRGTDKTIDRRPFFIRAEISKSTVYKGEQLIVSYYLYRKAKVSNIQVTQYPVLSGFIREDLEIPVLGQRLTAETVQLNGNVYERALLARYAAYPIKEGKLKIDKMSVKAIYYSGSEQNRGAFGDDEDPFLQFFGRLTPQESTQSSDWINIEVLPLPEAPSGLSGINLVGDFEVTAAISKTELKVDEPTTFTLMIQGKGNLSSLKEPTIKWPEGLELFEAKSKTKNQSAGTSEKMIEYLLIPRKAGKYEIPQVTFSFFNPEKKLYDSKSSNKVDLNVEGVEGKISEQEKSPPLAQNSPLTKGSQNAQSISPFKINISDQFKKLIFAFFGIILLIVGVLFVFLYYKAVQRKRKEDQSTASQFLRLEAELKLTFEQIKKSSKQGPSGLLKHYQKLADHLLGATELSYSIAAKSLSRVQIKEFFAQQSKEDQAVWEEISRVLERVELLCFSGNTQQNEGPLQEELTGLVKQVTDLIRFLSTRTL